MKCYIKCYDVLRKTLLIFLLLSIVLGALFNSVFYSVSFADTKTDKMIDFFRQSRNSIDVNAVSVDELRVYGVFLSNFLFVGQTKLSDLEKEDLAKIVVGKFFGGSDRDRVDEVVSINKKIYDAIKSNLSKTVKLGSGDAQREVRVGRLLFPNSKTDAASDGVRLIEAFIPGDIENEGSESSIQFVKADGSLTTIDLSDISFQGMFRVMAGVVPQFYLGSNNLSCVPRMTEFYVDGFGNIWGAPHGFGTIDDLILVYPACINPIAFSRGEYKLPVNNVYATGVMLRFSDASANRKISPYYDMENLFVWGTNFMGGIGVTVAGDGEINNITGNPYKDTMSESDIRSFLQSSSSGGDISNSTDFLLLQSNLRRFEEVMHSCGLTGSGGMLKDGTRAGLLYLLNPLYIPMGKVYTESYYFKLNSSGVQSTSVEGGTVWDSTDVFGSAVVNQDLFRNKGGAYFNTKASGADIGDVESWVGSDSVYVDGSGIWKRGGKVKFRSDFLNRSDSKNIGRIYAEPVVLNLNTGDFGGWLASWIGYDVYDGYFGVPLDKSTSHLRANVLSSSSQDNFKSLIEMVYPALGFRYFSMQPDVTAKLSGLGAGSKLGSGGDEGFTVETRIANEVNNFPGMYWGYLVSILDIKISGDGKVEVGSTSGGELPSMEFPDNKNKGFDPSKALTGDNGSSMSKEQELEDAKENIVKRVNGLLDPNDNSYREAYITSMQNSWVVSNHKKLVGYSGVDAVKAGTTEDAYAPAKGFLTTPTIRDYSILKFITDNIKVLFYLIGSILLVYFLIAFFLGKYSFGTCVISFFSLLILVFVPYVVISISTNISNDIGNKVFSNKFNYWALVQHQKGITELANAEDTGVSGAMANANNIYRRDGSIRLKWMSPKKLDEFKAIFGSHIADNTLKSKLVLFRYFMASYLYQDEYVDGLNSYIYRPYNSVAADALNGYNIGRESGNNEYTVKGYGSMYDLLGEKLVGGGTVPYTPEGLDAVRKVSAGDGFDNLWYRYALYEPSVLRVGYNDISSGLSIDSGVDSVALWGRDGKSSTNPNGVTFLLYTESPFYYFYNSLRTRFTSGDVEFKVALSKLKNYRTEGFDGMEFNNLRKDFLDIEGLFTYVIPLLDDMNFYVNKWGSLYGLDVEKYNFSDESDTRSIEEMRAYDHFKAVRNVWTMYSPWVAAIRETYGGSELTYIANKSVRVGMPYLLSEYRNIGRDMVFSLADMRAKGMEVSNLTTVERNILWVLEKTEEDMFYLVNYFDFDNETLLAASAMAATFRFNQVFNGSAWSSNTQMYPRGYELRNFSFDAFLRLGLLNATGEPLMESKDLYSRVIDKSGFWIGITLLLVDLCGVLFIPIFKASLLVALFVLLFFGVLACLIRVTMSDKPIREFLKFVFGTVMLPVIYFTLLNSIFVFLLGGFVGDGQIAYTGTRGITFNIDSAGFFLGIVLALSIIYGVVWYKLIKHVVVLIWESFKMVMAEVRVTGFSFASALSAKFSGRGDRGGAFGLDDSSGESETSGEGVDYAESIADAMKPVILDFTGGEGYDIGSSGGSESNAASDVGGMSTAEPVTQEHEKKLELMKANVQNSDVLKAVVDELSGDEIRNTELGILKRKVLVKYYKSIYGKKFINALQKNGLKMGKRKGIMHWDEALVREAYIKKFGGTPEEKAHLSGFKKSESTEVDNISESGDGSKSGNSAADEVVAQNIDF